ncbi:unnamed protein product [Polarella glacialis]|uniref:Uncharacterized protein n=1 Tax=Polarella glacialis TaxID=89957 RepID=A0A813IBK0_POLGL|nr:unnamed protein product [Polarella glacialis]
MSFGRTLRTSAQFGLAALSLTSAFDELPDFDGIELQDIVRVAYGLQQGDLDCQAESRDRQILDALRRYGAIPDSCFGGGFSRAFCCSSKQSACFTAHTGMAYTQCCEETDYCFRAFQSVVARTHFESCIAFLQCGGPLFLPCVTWNLGVDEPFDNRFAMTLLKEGHVRCFVLKLFANPSSVDKVLVFGLDVWFLGVCLPRICDEPAVKAHLEDFFLSVPLARITGNRVTRLSELQAIEIEELIHWAQLELDFAIIGPPNSGTSSVHGALMSLPGVRFIGDSIDEMDLPVAWQRTAELWGWRCTAPPMVPASWASGLGIELRSQGGGDPEGVPGRTLVGFRNPKLVYSQICLENLMSIPGFRILAMWRDPIEWMWSSLHRAFEHFNVSSEDAHGAWLEMSGEGEASAAPRADSLHASGGGIPELLFWRLGVPVNRANALAATTFGKLADSLADRFAVVDFELIRSRQRGDKQRLLQRLGRFLGLSAPFLGVSNFSAAQLLSHNVRRRRAASGNTWDLCSDENGLANITRSLEEFFDDEYSSLEPLLARHGLRQLQLRSRFSCARS